MLVRGEHIRLEDLSQDVAEGVSILVVSEDGCKPSLLNLISVFLYRFSLLVDAHVPLDPNDCDPHEIDKGNSKKPSTSRFQAGTKQV